jgi:hypothetical protein
MHESVRISKITSGEIYRIEGILGEDSTIDILLLIRENSCEIGCIIDSERDI